MSWIGGLNDSFNQLTSKAGQIGGQLSSFTKEVLAETTEEDIDLEADVKALRVKLIDAEATVNQQQAQIANQQKNIFELEEQCRRSELDAHSRICQYEAKLEQQAKLLTKLKHENVPEEEFQIVARGDAYRSESRRTFSGSSHDAADYADVIGYQQEIARLLEELELSKQENERWKAMMEKSVELELRLHETINHHQHEYLALQQANSITVQQLQEQIRFLRSQVTGDDRNLSVAPFEEKPSQKQAFLSLQAELDEYKEKLRTKNRQLQAQKKTIEELRLDTNSKEKYQEDLKKQLKSLEIKVAFVSDEKEKCEVEANTEIKKFRLFCEDMCEIAGFNYDDKSISHEAIVNHVKSLRDTCDEYHEEIVNMKKKMEDLEKEKYEIIDTLNESVESGKENVAKQQVSVGHAKKLTPLYQSSPAVERTQSIQTDENFFIVSPVGTDIGTIPPGEVTQTLQTLQKQVDDYELELAEYALVREEWEREKEALQSVLEQYEGKTDKNATEKPPSSQKASVVAELQHEIRDLQAARVCMENDKLLLIQEKDQLQTAVHNLQDELNQSISEARTERDRLESLKAELASALSEKNRLEALVKTVSEELNSSKMEKTDLDAELIALDEQHQAEINELLAIRDELNKKLKNSGSELQFTMKEMDELRNLHHVTRSELNELKEKSNETEIQTVLEEMSLLMDEKQNLEAKLEKTVTEMNILGQKLSDSEKKILNAIAKYEELKTALDETTAVKMTLEKNILRLEAERQSDVERLKAEIHDHEVNSLALRERLSLLEKQKADVESDCLVAFSKLEEQKSVEKKTLDDLSVLQEKQKDLEAKSASLLSSKDAEINHLRSELQVLKDENAKRVEQLTKQSDSETAANSELSTVKNELARIHQRLEAAEVEKKDLVGQIQDLNRKNSVLTEELGNKAMSLSHLSKEMEEKTSNFSLKFKDLQNDYESKLEAMEGRQHSELLELQEFYNNQIRNFEAKISEDKEHLRLMEEEKLTLKHENSNLSEKVKFIEQELTEEFEKTQEKIQQSTEEHNDQIMELKSVIERLTRELNQQIALVESLEEENKKQLEIQEDKKLKSELEFSQLHSAALSETNKLKTVFEEEKEKLQAEHSKEINKAKSDCQEQLEKLKEFHSEKLSSVVAELKRNHQAEQDALKQRVQFLENDIKDTDTELISAQNDLKTLTEHYEKQEEKSRHESSERLEELKLSHQKELLELQSEMDELIQQNMHQTDSNSINNELVQSQIMQLQDENQTLLVEIQNLKNSSAKIQENLSLKLDEISSLNQQILTLQEQKNNFESELSKLKDANLRLLESQNANKDTPPEAQKRKIELLKQDINQGISNSCPNLTQLIDLEGVEKSDLSKEDISSLLAVIKERDHVIGTLQDKNIKLTSQLKSKGTPDADVRVKQLTEEKEQMLSVISDKSKENRQLKDELHKMVDVIAAEKNALSKVQEENQVLIAKYEGFDQEMNRETVARLSKLISEKDLEIESFKQKCQTLLDVLQQQEQRQGVNETAKNEPQVPAQQVQALLRDRETLAQQVRQLLAERDHLVTLVNTKHQEALLFQERAQKAADSLEQDAAENSRLQILYSNLVHDYEQVELRLSAVQKDVAKFKESLNHMEESKEILFAKLDLDAPAQVEQSSQLLDVMENLRSDSTKSIGGKTKEDLERIVEKNSEALLQKDVLLQENLQKLEALEKQIEQFQRDIREKDILIHQKTNKMKQISEDLAQKTNEISILRRSVENLREQVSASNENVSSLNERLESAERVANEKESEAEAFQETNAQLSVMLKEREYELEALREKVGSVTELLQQQEQGKSYEAQKYLQELDRVKDQATSAKHERDQIMLTLKQKQIESQRSSEEARQLRDKEVKLQSELNRLRSHLVQVEETYTQEAVLSGEREQALRERLEQIQSKNASAVEANELSKQQLESLQEQVRSATQQRDQALHNFQLAKEQSSQYAGALQQLQIAAERMQRDEAATYAARVDKINQQYREKAEEVNSLLRQLQESKLKLDEANDALESASRLNEQLEAKEEAINHLKNLVSEKQLEVEEIQDELHKINAKSENMVDSQLVKNLLIGYFNSPANKKDDVTRLIASVIGFTKEEEMKLHPARKGWVSGWLPWGRGDASEMRPQHANENLNESFTGMFVKFLENESTAKQPIAKLPAAAMVNEAQQKMNQRKNLPNLLPTPTMRSSPQHSSPERSTVAGRYNPFLAPSVPNRSDIQAPAGSPHPLMQPLGSTLPTFTPFTNQRTSERDILKGILQENSS